MKSDREALVVDSSVYDAAFIALAEELGCRLVTADRKLFDRAGEGPIVLLSSIQV